MENTESRLYFASDYMEGAHPAIMKKLMETNLEKTVGYGQDPYTEDAKEKIRKACNAPEADVFLLVGGTQTNATVIDALLKSYQGVVAADTGHIATHATHPSNRAACRRNRRSRRYSKHPCLSPYYGKGGLMLPAPENLSYARAVIPWRHTARSTCRWRP